MKEVMEIIEEELNMVRIYRWRGWKVESEKMIVIMNVEYMLVKGGLVEIEI